MEAAAVSGRPGPVDGEVLAPRPTPGRVPNLVDYVATRTAFRWDDAAAALDGLPGGGLNLCHEAADRHAAGPRRDRSALRFLHRDGAVTEWSYAELADHTRRFAEVLDHLGVGRGDVVASLLGRRPELYAGALGILRVGAVFCPLFSAFGPDPVRQRLERGDARAVLTTASLYRKRLADRRRDLPGLRHVLLVDGADAPDLVDPPAGVHDLAALLAATTGERPVTATTADDPALLHFTSGSTGMPKGALHVHGAGVVHHASARTALDLHPDDVYWCTADPGWVTGTSYGILAPLLHGVTVVVDEGEFDARRWYATLAAQRVTVWYTAPTALRMLMAAGDDEPGEHDLSALAVIASVGEPLNPEVVRWGDRVLGRIILDNWWQTETGGIMVSNFVGCEVRPGSMGRPLPGIDVALLAMTEDPATGAARPVLDDAGRPVEVGDPDTPGMLAVRTPWPSMFRGYLHDDDRYRRCFAGGWYLSGDLATRDEDGFHRFVGRADDVIKTAGHLVGPFEVESALLEHPDVVEAAVIGLPDPVAGNVIAAWVTLRPGVEWSDDLRLSLVGHARSRLGPAVAPRRIECAADLPRTRSGKIMRRLLRARELGLPEGDVSTLEPGRAPGGNGADGTGADGTGADRGR